MTDLPERLERLIQAAHRADCWQAFLHTLLQNTGASYAEIQAPGDTTPAYSAGDQEGEGEIYTYRLGPGRRSGTLRLRSAQKPNQNGMAHMAALVAGLVLAEERRNREADELMRGVLHDFRGGLLQISRAAHSGEAGAVDSALTVVDHFLKDLAALHESGRPREAAGFVPLNSVYDTVRWNLKKALLEKEGKLEIEGGGELAVHAAERDVADVLGRLIDNSLKFAGPQPVVTLLAARDDGGVNISIQDSGPGIEPQYAERIFRPFQRLHGKKFPGHGLGLAICRNTVEALGGRIWLSPNPPSGALFHVWLPA